MSVISMHWKWFFPDLEMNALTVKFLNNLAVLCCTYLNVFCYMSEVTYFYMKLLISNLVTKCQTSTKVDNKNVVGACVSEISKFLSNTVSLISAANVGFVFYFTMLHYFNTVNSIYWYFILLGSGKSSFASLFTKGRSKSGNLNLAGVNLNFILRLCCGQHDVFRSC